MSFYVTTELRQPLAGERYIALDGSDEWQVWDARPELCDGYENGEPVRLPRLVVTGVVAADAGTREGRGGESSVPVSADSLCTSAATPAVEREHIKNGDPCWCNPTVIDYSRSARDDYPANPLAADSNEYRTVSMQIDDYVAATDELDRLRQRALHLPACASCGANDTEGNELITDAEGSVFCEDCYQP